MIKWCIFSTQELWLRSQIMTFHLSYHEYDDIRIMTNINFFTTSNIDQTIIWNRKMKTNKNGLHLSWFDLPKIHYHLNLELIDTCYWKSENLKNVYMTIKLPWEFEEVQANKSECDLSIQCPLKILFVGKMKYFVNMKWGGQAVKGIKFAIQLMDVQISAERLWQPRYFKNMGYMNKVRNVFKNIIYFHSVVRLISFYWKNVKNLFFWSRTEEEIVSIVYTWLFKH